MQLLINIDVPDLERGIAFYAQGVGLHLRRRLFGGTVAEMGGARVPVYLLAQPAGSSASAFSKRPREYGRHWTPVHLDFVVDDIERAVAGALEAGATLEAGPTSAAWGWLATLGDPFGHGLCFVQWSGAGYNEAT